jgi:RNA polymerase sigma-70 factor (ECF subfamily)
VIFLPIGLIKTELRNDCLHNEKEILFLVSKGDEHAFSKIVKYYSAIIYTHALTYIKNAVQAEEITQDIFLSLWQRREELNHISNFQGYLYAMVRNRTISEFRKKILELNSKPVDELESLSPGPADSVEMRELLEILMRGIQKLPTRRKQVFTMSRFDGMSYNEIAKNLGISKSSVNQHIVEALVFLRTYLRNQMAVLALIGLSALT